MYKETQLNTKASRIKSIFNFYVFSNLHVALATFCLVKITLLNIGISENTTAWFVFFATLVSYNSIRFLRLKSIGTWYNKWLKKNLTILYSLTGISVIIIVILAFQLRLKAIFLLLPFSLVTLFYVFPIKKYALRNIGSLKLFLIAISWAGITVLFPLVQNYITLRVTDYITFFQRFIFIIIITIPFDIRDIDYDSTSLNTLPQQLGIDKVKYIAYFLLLLFLMMEWLKPTTEQHIYSVIAITILSSLLLKFSTKNQSKYYSAFFVEALPIVWFFLTIV